jgi:hypothetical protein
MKEVFEHMVLYVIIGMMMGLLFFKTCILPESGNIFNVGDNLHSIPSNLH